MNYGLLSSILLAFCATGIRVIAYEAVPRWGQATAVINGAVFIHGGKIDKSNQYSYTSAPNTDDLLFLSLDQGFDVSSPPWELISSSANSTSPQGPALSWHTLSAYNTSQLLLFGGQPGPNSPTVVATLSDSSFIVDVSDFLEPHFLPEDASWAGQPVRRIHHSTASTVTGLIYIIGGEKADGSGLGFSDHYVFDPDGPSFTQIPSDNGPPDIYGHVSIILADGRLLVFGGFSQSQNQLIPFSTIWALDTTQDSLKWVTVQVSTNSLPSPRRAFVAVLIGDGKILIHGGSDASLQNNFDDGWILDTTQNPMIWIKVDILSELGARRDHFAISSGVEVIFGFGYGNNGPVNATLQIYDIPSGSFVPTYSPPPATVTFTQTIPGPTVTTTKIDRPQTTILGGNPSAVVTATVTRTDTHPTFTLGPGNPSTPSGTANPEDNNDHSRGRVTAIAVGSAVGALSLIAICGLALWYYRRRKEARAQRFEALGDRDDDDDNDSPHTAQNIPVAAPIDEKMGASGPGFALGALASLPIIGGTISALSRSKYSQPTHQRRDMLADEDTREFGNWWDNKRRDGTGGSSWSLRSILTRRMRSREPSTLSTANATPFREKSDPFGDGASLMRDLEGGYAAASLSRPQGRREYSYASTMTGMSSYVDPFVGSQEGHGREDSEIQLVPRDGEENTEFDSYSYNRPTVRPVQPPPPLDTMLPLAMAGGHVLSPLSEHTSQATLSTRDPSASVSSHAQSSENPNSPFDSNPMSRVTSHTSFEGSRSPVTGASSIIGASAQPTQPMRRSDSWWARFSRTSFLDRRSSTASRRSMAYDIRDPNPPPRLVAIQESVHSASVSPQSGSAKAGSREGSRVYGAHGKSMTSLRTADSEAIDRMAGNMDVIQRIRTGSHRTTGSTSTTGGVSVDAHDAGGYGDMGTFMSPVEMNQVEAAAVPLPPSTKSSAKAPSPARTPPEEQPPTPSSTSSKSPPPSRGSAVAARVQAYERRFSQDTQDPSTNTRQYEERPKGKRVSVDYGLVPRASLFVANPDHRLNPSNDS